MIYCMECKGTNVQHVMWVSSNTLEVQDDYGEWKDERYHWCEDCSEHTELMDEDIEPRQIA